MNNQRFFKVGSTFFNIDFVKTFQCDEKKCELQVDHKTQHRHIMWYLDRQPELYQDARRNWLILERKHQQYVFNAPMNVLERNTKKLSESNSRN